jgi:hypothetical protein
MPRRELGHNLVFISSEDPTLALHEVALRARFSFALRGTLAVPRHTREVAGGASTGASCAIELGRGCCCTHAACVRPGGVIAPRRNRMLLRATDTELGRLHQRQGQRQRQH